MLAWVITVGTLIGTVYGESRIIGGKNTTISNHPYQVSLQTKGADHFCGGFLISKTWVVTAAHCVDHSIKTHRIRAGSTFYNRQGQTCKIRKAIVHPNFSWSTFNNDIALLQLDSPVTAKNAKSASLPSQDQNIPDGINLNVTGWGVTNLLGGRSSEHLQVVQVPTVNRKVCREKYRYPDITNSMLCAGFLNTGGKDSCSGDSGGAAAKGNTVYGIVLFGVGCADPDYPGVYTQVSSHRNWIKKHSGI